MPSKSQSQQQAAAIALQVKRGEKPKSSLKGSSKNMYKMSEKDLEKFARTKHKGLPYKKSKKVDEAFGEKLDVYIDIIWRWFERQGYAEHEIDSILNDSKNMETIESAEAHGINPILVAKDLNTEVLVEATKTYESFVPESLEDLYES